MREILVITIKRDGKRKLLKHQIWLISHNMIGLRGQGMRKESSPCASTPIVEQNSYHKSCVGETTVQRKHSQSQVDHNMSSIQSRPRSLATVSQNISSSTHHIKSLNACIKH
jgi:hypothetical protein